MFSVLVQFLELRLSIYFGDLGIQFFYFTRYRFCCLRSRLLFLFLLYHFFYLALRHTGEYELLDKSFLEFRVKGSFGLRLLRALKIIELGQFGFPKRVETA